MAKHSIMQSTEDLQAKVLRKKPKPNNKTKTLSKQRPGEDFKSRACSLSRKFDCNERNCCKSVEIQDISKNKTEIFQESIDRKANIIKDESVSNYNLHIPNSIEQSGKDMSTKNNLPGTKSRAEILATRQNKKQMKKNSNEVTKDFVETTKTEQKEYSEEFKEKTSAAISEDPSLNQITSIDNLSEKISNCEISKSREQVIAERQAKKLAKQIKKNKSDDNPTEIKKIDVCLTSTCLIETDKNKDQIPKSETKNANKMVESNINDSTEETRITVSEKKTLSKSERRAIQEAQRAAKAKMLEEKQNLKKKSLETVKKDAVDLKPVINESNVQQADNKPSKLKSFTSEYKVKLFKHLDREDLQEKNQFINHAFIHPSIVQLGEQISTRTVVGSNARCISFLKALKVLIQDYQTPPKKEFTRGLEESINKCVQYLDKCRPLAVSVNNAHKAIQSVLRHLSNESPESELKEHLCEHIDTYIRDQIEKAAQAISVFVQEKISEGDVILTYSCSSLIYQILEDAYNRKIDFRVIVVDSRPFLEGRELFRKLILKEIPCTYVLINAIGFIMPEVTKILMGAHALLANGNVMARTGTAQIALVAKSFNVPVLVCCETHKFSDRVQTDAIVYNELGNPDDLIMNKTCKLSNWRKGANKILPLNLNYDITPPELVTAVVTEVAILPCTSVPVILRLRPTDLY